MQVFVQHGELIGAWDEFDLRISAENLPTCQVRKAGPKRLITTSMPSERKNVVYVRNLHTLCFLSSGHDFFFASSFHCEYKSPIYFVVQARSYFITSSLQTDGNCVCWRRAKAMKRFDIECFRGPMER